MSKHILVTGGSGMLGRHVVEACKAKGWYVVSIHSVDANLVDANEVDKAFGYFVDTAEVVVHCAASVGGIGKNIRNPYRQAFENAQFGINVLNECIARSALVSHFINIGSCCQYPANAPQPYREESMWDGYPEPTNGPYGIAKRFVCELARAAHEQYGLGYTNLILANLFGPHDNFDLENSHVIPALIRKFDETTEGEVTLWGDGTPRREFLHAGDAANAIVKVIEAGPQNDTFNVGGTLSQIAATAEVIADYSGFKGTIVWDTDKPKGAASRAMDSEKFRAKMRWKPGDFVGQLCETIDWFKDNKATARGMQRV